MKIQLGYMYRMTEAYHFYENITLVVGTLMTCIKMLKMDSGYYDSYFLCGDNVVVSEYSYVLCGEHLLEEV